MLVFGVDFGEIFTSSGRILVDVLGPAVCLLSGKAAYCSRIADRVYLGLVDHGDGVESLHFRS